MAKIKSPLYNRHVGKNFAPKRKKPKTYITPEEKYHQLRAMQGIGWSSMIVGMLPLLSFFTLMNALFKFSRRR